MNKLRKPIFGFGIVILAAMVLIAFTPTASAANGGAPPVKPVDLAWHDDVLWDSVVLGPLHGNPAAHTLDDFYVGLGQNPVAGAGPGDSDYNGGRWIPTVLSWVGAGAQPTFTDGDDIEAALASGDLIVIATGAPFLCPLTNPNNSA